MDEGGKVEDVDGDVDVYFEIFVYVGKVLRNEQVMGEKYVVEWEGVVVGSVVNVQVIG